MRPKLSVNIDHVYWAVKLQGCRAGVEPLKKTWLELSSGWAMCKILWLLCIFILLTHKLTLSYTHTQFLLISTHLYFIKFGPRLPTLPLYNIFLSRTKTMPCVTSEGEVSGSNLSPSKDLKKYILLFFTITYR